MSFRQDSQRGFRSLKVCPQRDAHFRINAAGTISHYGGYFLQELFEDEKPKVDVASFQGEAKLRKPKSSQRKWSCNSRWQRDWGRIHCCVMNSFFMMGSMGQVFGEKITKAFQEGTKRHSSCDFYCQVAPEQEGIFSLRNMKSQELWKNTIKLDYSI